MKPILKAYLVLQAFSIFSNCNVYDSSRYDSSRYDSSRKQFIYSLKQDDLMEKERIFEGRDYHLNKKERVVDNFLQYLKWKVLQQTAALGNYPPTRPVDEILEEIKASDIYKLLKLMPKGGILHTHENHQLGKKKLLELFMASNISRHLYVQHGINSTHEWKLEVHATEPGKPGLVNVLQNQEDPNFSVDNLALQQTMIGVMRSSPPMPPSDSAKRWKLANKVFGRGSSSLVVDGTMKKQYLRAMYEQGLSEGVFYFETRKSFSRLERDIHLTKELVEEFKKDHPEFVGHRRIYYSKRTDSRDDVAKELNELRTVMKLHPDHVVGYDLVGEEDWGSTNLHHIDDFLRHMDLHDSSGNVTNHIPWLLHTAESNWIENVHIPLLNKEDDSVPRSNNLYSSILLGAKRIGHGIGFWKHPYLMELMKMKKIPVEVCVVSNQLLGYTHDLRQHPAQLFHKMGIPVILSPDDPGLFGYDEVTLDWYEAFMGWSGLNLGDLRQFAINSIKYSGMNEEEKQRVIDGVLREKWEKYIDDVSKRACEEISASVLPRFEKLFPMHGSLARVSNIHILGFNFEEALCRRVWCRFGNTSYVVTKGMYASNQHLICKTPTLESIKQLDSLEIPIYITWSEEHVLIENDDHPSNDRQNHARQWIETGFKFQFHEFPIESVTSDDPSGATSDMRTSQSLLLVLLLLAFK